MSSVTAVPTPRGVVSTTDDTELARLTMRRASLRLLPFLVILFICNYLDRTNVAIAALQMNRDLKFSASAYGLGSGIFFVSASFAKSRREFPLPHYTVTALPTLGGTFAEVVALNNQGQVVGSVNLPNGEVRAALWENGTVTQLGTLGGR